MSMQSDSLQKGSWSELSQDPLHVFHSSLQWHCVNTLVHVAQMKFILTFGFIYICVREYNILSNVLIYDCMTSYMHFMGLLINKKNENRNSTFHNC